MTDYISRKFTFSNAEHFKESFMEYEHHIEEQDQKSSTEYEPTLLGYVFIGKHTNWISEPSPETLTDTPESEKSIWDNMIGAKIISGNDLEIVLPRVDYTSNVKYMQYDDTITLDYLITGNSSINLFPMYCFTEDYNVYKCLSNNNSSLSTVKPTTTGTNGIVITEDGYVWRYMYKVPEYSKFLNDEWIPAPQFPTNETYQVLDANTALKGDIHTIVVVNNGSGFISPNISVLPFSTNETVITVTDSPDISLSNVSVVGMSITGNGIANGTYIKTSNVISNQLTLSLPTLSAGGGANTLILSTRAEIVGNENITQTAKTEVTVNSETQTVNSISVIQNGIGYDWAIVNIYGTANNASARAIISPAEGHGTSPGRELCANGVMICVSIGLNEDSTDGGIISANTSYRQYGLLRNPYKYGETNALTWDVADPVVNQTLTLELNSVNSGELFDLNEKIYQGSANNPTFYGYVYSQTTNNVKLTQVRGTPKIGATILGLSSGRPRVVSDLTPPTFQPYYGDILYVDNVEKIERILGQTELLRFVVKF